MQTAKGGAVAGKQVETGRLEYVDERERERLLVKEGQRGRCEFDCVGQERKRG